MTDELWSFLFWVPWILAVVFFILWRWERGMREPYEESLRRAWAYADRLWAQLHPNDKEEAKP